MQHPTSPRLASHARPVLALLTAVAFVAAIAGPAEARGVTSNPHTNRATTSCGGGVCCLTVVNKAGQLVSRTCVYKDGTTESTTT